MVAQNDKRYPMKNISQSIDVRLLIIFVLACISFSTVSMFVVWDLSGYMNQALNIVTGKGYTTVDGQAIYSRPPVFPLMIALSYKLFGTSAESAFHVVRFFCILNPVLIYLFGKRLFNGDVGFGAGLLILSSYSISYWSYRHLDAVWPFFAILHSYLLYKGFENKKVAYFVLAGLTLGTAYLVKEVALLFFPFGIFLCLWVREYRTRENVVYVLISLFALAVTLLPWVIYLWWNDALHFLWGAGGPVVLADMVVGQYGVQPLLERFTAGLTQYIAAFVSFYEHSHRNTVAANFVIAPLFLLTWLFLLWAALTGDKRYKSLLLNIVLFLPIIYFIGKNHWRFGQVLHTMLISYLALSTMLFCLLDWIGRTLKLSEVTQRILFYTILLLVLVVQVGVPVREDKGYVQFFKSTIVYHYLKGQRNFADKEITGNVANRHLKQVINHLDTLSGFNAGLLTSGIEFARRVYFETNTEQRVDEIPYVKFWHRPIDLDSVLAENSGDKALFVTSRSKPSESLFHIYMTLAGQLEKAVKEDNIEYILLSPARPAHNDYFSASPRYAKLFSAGPKGRDDLAYHLYRVIEISGEEEGLPVITSRRLKNAMTYLQKNMPERYDFFKKILTSDMVNLPAEAFDHSAETH